VPLNIELKLEVVDSPNSAGIVIDAVRCAKLALDRGIAGTLEGPSSYFMKSPPIQHPDDICRNMTEAFIAGTSDAAVTGSLTTAVPGKKTASKKAPAKKKAGTAKPAAKKKPAVKKTAVSRKTAAKKAAPRKPAKKK
jgi:myo-inositol-1-phosphate synthase